MRCQFGQVSRLFPVLPFLPLAVLATAGAVSRSGVARAASTTALTAAAPSFGRDVLPTTRKYCVSCHSGKDPAAGIDLSRDANLAAMLAHRDRWARAAANIDNRNMPPTGEPAPSAAERARVADFVQSAIARADCALRDPGRVTVRRLNRTEYDNTVRDLTGVDLKLSADFPSDDVGYGFDNIGDVLSLSPLLMDKYFSAAEQIARAAIVAPEDRKQRADTARQGTLIPGMQMGGGGSFNGGVNGYFLATNSEAYYDFNFPAPGRYRFRIVAWEEHAGTDNAQMAIRFGGQTLRTVPVPGTQAKPSTFVVPIDVTVKGLQRLSVAFLNDYYDDANVDLKLRGDRNLVVDSFRIAPTANVILPDTVSGPEAKPQRLLPMLPAAPTELARAAATRTDITAFALRAYRRPPSTKEVDRLCSVAKTARDQGASFEAGMQYAIEAALVSPNFLFRFERDSGVSPAMSGSSPERMLSDYELATRLSYFLWSTMPDDRLLTLAAQGRLHDPAVLRAEGRRMIADPRSRALADNFAAQWLTLRKLQIVSPDPKLFPDWNEQLRSSMRDETLLYFDSVVRNDRSVLDFLDSNYTFLNEPLARLYGNTEVKGDAFRRVALRGEERGGLLTQASILTVTSNPNRTSPVKRGKWVMENLLGIAIPAPPPGVGQLPDDNHGAVVGTLRQRMEEHRKNPACASCHAQMDPIGFGLENYDAIGHWRTVDDNVTIDATGRLPAVHGDGQTFATPLQLRSALRARAPQFVHTLAEKLMTYALGRGVESYDRCNIDSIAAQAAAHDYHFSALIDAIVSSQPFRQRRGEAIGSKVASTASRGHTGLKGKQASVDTDF